MTVNEPENLTGWVDRSGGTWVRVDDCPGEYGNWWPRTDGPGWDARVQDGIGQAREWEQVLVDWPELSPADPALTAETIELVRKAWSR